MIGMYVSYMCIYIYIYIGVYRVCSGFRGFRLFIFIYLYYLYVYIYGM